MRRGQAKGALLEPIARWTHDGDNDTLLLDATAVRLHFGVSARTVRRRCEAAACDVRTRAPLYDQAAAARQLAGVRPRATTIARRAAAAPAYSGNSSTVNRRSVESA